MDLGAYMQIADLEEVAKANGIEVPRLRGYRLMANEEQITEEQIQEIIASHQGWIYEKCVTSKPRFYPDSGATVYGPAADRLKKKYLIYETHNDVREDGTEYSYQTVSGFRWELLHGKARKRLKLALKRSERNVRKQMDAFNKYAGKKNVLYIHARIGTGNWLNYDVNELEKQPWFIEAVDDHFDCTYCDIYARIKEGSNVGEERSKRMIAR